MSDYRIRAHHGMCLAFEKLVKEKILSAGRRKEICKGCQWEHICEKGDETV